MPALAGVHYLLEYQRRDCIKDSQEAMKSRCHNIRTLFSGRREGGHQDRRRWQLEFSPEKS